MPESLYNSLQARTQGDEPIHIIAAIYTIYRDQASNHKNKAQTTIMHSVDPNQNGEGKETELNAAEHERKGGDDDG